MDLEDWVTVASVFCVNLMIGIGLFIGVAAIVKEFL